MQTSWLSASELRALECREPCNGMAEVELDVVRAHYDARIDALTCEIEEREDTDWVLCEILTARRDRLEEEKDRALRRLQG